jgi:hypothetical protein
MKQRSRKHTWRNRLVAVGIAFALLYLWIVVHPPLWYYQQVGKPQELPQRLIRPAFRKIAGWYLPIESKELRALFHGGRDPAIFVRFQTDSEGISHIREQIAPKGGEYKTFSGSLSSYFYIISQWEDWSGIHILDQPDIKSGFGLEYSDYQWDSTVSIKILIDSQHNKVYIRGICM